MAKETDWEAIEREYRAGQLSVAEIGRQHGVSHTAINKRAKRDGWKRDLTKKVQAAARAKLVAAEVSPEVSEANARETIETAATRVVEVVRSHRKDISAGRRAASMIMDELLEATANRAEIEEEIDRDKVASRRAMMHRAVSVSARASAVLALAGAMHKFVQLERQAFNIEAGTEDDEPPAAVKVRFVDASEPEPDAQ